MSQNSQSLLSDFSISAPTISNVFNKKRAQGVPGALPKAKRPRRDPLSESEGDSVGHALSEVVSVDSLPNSDDRAFLDSQEYEDARPHVALKFPTPPPSTVSFGSQSNPIDLDPDSDSERPGERLERQDAFNLGHPDAMEVDLPVPNENVVPTGPVGELRVGEDGDVNDLVPEAGREWRTQATHLFLTYPQTEVTPEQFLANLVASPLAVRAAYVIVAQERHAEGGLHLHVYLRLAPVGGRRRVYVEGSTLASLCKPGDYKVCRKVANVIRYVLKHQHDPEDPERGPGGFRSVRRTATGEFVDFDWHLFLDLDLKKKPVVEVGMKIVREGVFDPVTALQEFGGVAVTHMGQFEKLASYVQRKMRLEGLRDFTPVNPLMNQGEEARFVDRMNRLVIKGRDMIANKQYVQFPMKRNVIIAWGPPNTRKTSFLEWIGRYLAVVKLNPTPEFPFNGCVPGQRLDVVVIEQFDPRSNRWSFQQFEQYVDGGSTHFNHKGSSFQLPLKCRPVFVFLQNIDPRTWWRIPREHGDVHLAPDHPDYWTVEWKDTLSPYQRAALDARLFEVFNITNPIQGFENPDVELADW